MPHILQKMIADESGATVIEYGMIALLIGVGLVATLEAMGTGLAGIFTAVIAGFSAV